MMSFVTAVNFMIGLMSRPVGIEVRGSRGLTRIRTGRASDRVVTATVSGVDSNWGSTYVS